MFNEITYLNAWKNGCDSLDVKREWMLKIHI